MAKKSFLLCFFRTIGARSLCGSRAARSTAENDCFLEEEPSIKRSDTKWNTHAQDLQQPLDKEITPQC